MIQCKRSSRFQDIQYTTLEIIKKSNLPECWARVLWAATDSCCSSAVLRCGRGAGRRGREGRPPPRGPTAECCAWGLPRPRERRPWAAAQPHRAGKKRTSRDSRVPYPDPPSPVGWVRPCGVAVFFFFWHTCGVAVWWDERVREG
jgi:hypothetical protein